MNKTRVVEVVRTFRHPAYKKVMRRSTKFYAHDEKGQSHVGDKVKIMETRPMSKLKRWRLVEIVEKAK
jgi:small subunit ribosomal protein S17